MNSSLRIISRVIVASAMTVSLTLGSGLPLVAFADPAPATLAAPTVVSPADGTTIANADLAKIDWTDVTGDNGPVTYSYEVSDGTDTNGDGSFSHAIFNAGPLSVSEIANGGTPNGVYYWHVKAQDSASTSPWSPTYKLTISDTPPAPTTQTCSFVSDATTQADGHDSVVESPNALWTSIPGASWIWTDTLTNEEAASGTTATFVKTFNVTGATPTGTLDIASDNGYILSVNGHQIDDKSGQDNYSATTTYDISSYLVAGNNTVQMVVNNSPGSDAVGNPAGLLYKLSVTGDTCGAATVDNGGGEGGGNPPPPASCDAGVNLLQNSDFEYPVINNESNWDIVPSGTTGFDWIVQWLGPSIDGRPGTANAEIQHNFSGWPAADGTQWTELDSDWNGPNGHNGDPSSVSLSQTISTVPGDTYTFTFNFSPRPGTGTGENVVNALANGTVIGTASASTTVGSTVWTPETFTFIATSSQTTFSLADAGSPNDGYGPYVDKTSLTCAPPEVTPPPTCTIVSDTTTQVNGGNSVVLNFIHDSWTHLLDSVGAKWIWAEEPLPDPTADETQVFTKTIFVSGTPTSASVDLAADNGYQIRVNGTMVADHLTEEHNYEGTTTIGIPLTDLLANATNTVEFTVKNFAMDGGTQQSNPAGLDYVVNINGSSCTAPTPPKTDTLTVVATKIVCPDEADLPNWGTGGHNIDANTATDFLKDHPSCHLQSGWNFQWGSATTTDGGDSTIGPVADYTEFGPTDVSGNATTTISFPDGTPYLHFREELQDGYIPFTFGQNHDDSNNVSAEFYCANDALHYDNYDFIWGPQASTTYYCVAFNAPTQPQEPSTVKAHIYKYLDNGTDGTDITQVADDSGAPLFPMTSTWQAANLSGGATSSGSYYLGNNEGGTALKYAADTSPMDAPAYYTTQETVDGNTVVANADSCTSNSQYYLEGYKMGSTLGNAETATMTTSPPEFINMNSDGYIIVVNKQCSGGNEGGQTGSIVITKYLCPADTTVNRTDNGVNGEVPEGCTADEGASFGYVHGDQTDANAPYPELGESLTAGGSTDGSGVLSISNLPANGRYLVEETNDSNQRLDDSQVLGLYCTGDGDTSGNNDNQELTFVPAGGTTQCVAYDPAPATEQGTLTIIKNTKGGDGTFHFDVSQGENEGNQYTLTTVGGASSTVISLDPGTYDVTEQQQEGWTLDAESPNCVYDNDETGTAIDSGESVDVIGGENVTCTFDNTKSGDNGGGGTSTTTQTIIVHQSDLATNLSDALSNPSKWFFLDDQAPGFDIDNTKGSMVTGPGTPPLPVGSAQISATSTQGIALDTLGYNGIALKNIKQLSYSTYRSAGDPALALALQFDINTTGTTTPSPYQGRLVYEPYYTHTVLDNTWQTWNPMDDATSGTNGNWWFSKSAIATASGCTQATPCTWSQILALYPNIGITGSTDFKAGSNWASSFTGNVDAFVIGVQNGTNTTVTTYDFEPDPSTPPVTPHFSFFSGGSSGGTINPPKGQVLGASCGPVVNSFIHFGWANDATDVSNLQAFLNKELGLSLPITGVYDMATFEAVMAFQLKYAASVLAPWINIPGSGINSLSSATGYVYKTTQWEINMVNCPDLNLPFPQLP